MTTKPSSRKLLRTPDRCSESGSASQVVPRTRVTAGESRHERRPSRSSKSNAHEVQSIPIDRADNPFYRRVIRLRVQSATCFVVMPPGAKHQPVVLDEPVKGGCGGGFTLTSA